MHDQDPLIAFLRERLDEDEQAASIIQVGGFHPPTWSARPGRSRRWMEVVGRSVMLGDPDDEWCDDGVIALVPDSRCEWAHIARHDPARVLREVAAKRRIIAECTPSSGVPALELAAALGALVLARLAETYSDHPDYRDEWMP